MDAEPHGHAPRPDSAPVVNPLPMAWMAGLLTPLWVLASWSQVYDFDSGAWAQSDHWAQIVAWLATTVGLAANLLLLIALTILAAMHRPAPSPIPEIILTVTNAALIAVVFGFNSFREMGSSGFSMNTPVIVGLSAAGISATIPTLLMWVPYARSKISRRHSADAKSEA